jgi:hypothetical protein
MKLNKNILLIIILSSFSLFIILLSFYYNNRNNHHKLKYFRCNEKPLGKIINTICINNNIIKDNNNWDLYVPCGYNFVEKELLLIELPKYNKKYYIFGINGCDNIVSKNNLWNILDKKYTRDQAKTLMPETYILDRPADMNLFRLEFSPNNIYILKKNLQRKEGLKLSNDLFEINSAYNDNYRVVQKYIRNLYLINGYKVNLRIYLLIYINNNKKYFYLSNNGKCIYTSKKYKDDDFDFETNITSYHLDMDIYNNNPRTLLDLAEYLNNNQKNSKILFDNIQTLMHKFAVAAKDHIFQSDNLNFINCHSFQLFGIDIIFDKLLNCYLLEINKGPDMNPRDDTDFNMKYQVQNDMLNTINLINNQPDAINSFKLIYSN